MLVADDTPMKIRRYFGAGLLFLFAAGAGGAESTWDRPTAPLRVPVEIVVHRSESCGCCSKWLAHMKKHGFQVKDVLEENMNAVKDALGVPPALRSCHTGVVAGHVIEGHVPAGDVKKLLESRSGPYGLAVPGMPVGAPGMEMGDRKDPFSVIGFDRDGKTSVFSEYQGY